MISFNSCVLSVCDGGREVHVVQALGEPWFDCPIVDAAAFVVFLVEGHFVHWYRGYTWLH